jgi:hypothetical protein
MKIEKLSVANYHARSALNDMAALSAIGLFGHLRRTEIAMAVWPASPQASAERMTSILLKRLLNARMIASAINATGTTSYHLTKKGVGLLRSYGSEIGDAGQLSSISGPQFYHRTLGTLYLLEKGREQDGIEVLGEYALLRGYGSISRKAISERFHKFPDGIVIRDARKRDYDFTGKVVDWIEVESAYKSQENLDSILNIAWQAGGWLDLRESMLLDRIVFVVNRSQAHEKYIMSAIRRHIKDKPTEVVQHFLAGIVIARADVQQPLRWRGLEEVSALDLGLLPRE